MIKTPLLLLNYFTYNYYKEKLKKNYYKLLKNIVLHTIIKESLHKINPKFDQAFLTNILESAIEEESDSTKDFLSRPSILSYFARYAWRKKDGIRDGGGGEAEEKSEQS